jgi:hypothetical protein
MTTSNCSLILESPKSKIRLQGAFCVGFGQWPNKASLIRDSNCAMAGRNISNLIAKNVCFIPNRNLVLLKTETPNPVRVFLF